MDWRNLRVPGLLCHILLPLLVVGGARAQNVVINEIMYHVKETEFRENDALEFIELHNAGDEAISLKGWQFTSGINYKFGNVSIAPNGFLVVAANPEALKAQYPDLRGLDGPFKGKLSNSGEKITLENADGDEVDELTYADKGAWAKRATQKLKSYDDWIWEAKHDGGGHSMELTNARVANEIGHFWGDSVAAGGSPGAPNGNVAANVAPAVASVMHDPLIPSSKVPVIVSATVIDGTAPTDSLTLYYRADGNKVFKSVPMKRSADSVWQGKISPRQDKMVMQFYVEAKDSAGGSRTFPELISGGKGSRQALCLYQVDDGFDAKAESAAGAKPTYRIISTAKEIELMRKIQKKSGSNNAYDNHLHCTFISVDGVDTKVRYSASVRIRGHGSRSQFPPGMRVSFPSDDRWKGVDKINLNSQYTQAQSLGAAIHQLCGFASAGSTPVRVLMNGKNWAKKGSPQFGCYVHNEVFDSDYLKNHFPGEDGNLYRAVANANLDTQVRRPSDMTRFRKLYSKRNHSSDDDYSDMMALIAVLMEKNPGPDYFDRVNKVLDIEQWARFIATDALLCNLEGGFTDGRGDDFCMFFRKDGRVQILPYDLDSILGMGDGNRNIRKGIFQYGNMPGMRNLFREPKFRRLYFEKFREMTDTVYNTETLYPLIDDRLGGWIPDNRIKEIKEFMAQRIEIVMDQIRSNTVIGTTLPVEGGLFKATNDKFALYGRFSVASVQEITVGGLAPKVFEQSGDWVLLPDQVKKIISPGINQVAVVMRDHNGDVVERQALRVWVDRGEVTEISGDIPAGQSVTWKLADGPRFLGRKITIPEGASLTIEPGVTVYTSPQAGLLVQGKLVAVGTESAPITFFPKPGEATASAAAVSHFIEVRGSADLAHTSITAGVTKALIDVNAGARLAMRSCALAGDSLADASSITVGDGHIEVDQCEFARGNSSEPAIRIIAGPADRYQLITRNLFKGGATPCLVTSGKTLVDGNDFVMRGENVHISSTEGAVLTRNRQGHGKPLPLRDVVAAKATILSQPPARTGPGNASFAIGGEGVVAFRYRIDNKSWSDDISVSDGGALRLPDLSAGTHQLFVLGKNVAGQWQADSKPTASQPFEILEGITPLRLSEIAAVGEDFIEIENFGAEPFDISGYYLSDGEGAAASTDSYRFPSGSVIAPGAFLVVKSNKDTTGFALSRKGETVTLADRARVVVDRVTYGLQIDGHSIGQSLDGWQLGVPTPGEANASTPLGDPFELTISEWQAVGSLAFPEDFVDVTNPAAEPIAIGGLALTDNIPNRAEWNVFPPLSFVTPNSTTSFIADGKPKQGADHLDFRLSGEGETIGLMHADGRLIAHASFGPQTTGYSQGRDDTGKFVYLDLPSPGNSGKAILPEGDALVMGALRISEIHFHPRGEGDDEFLELTNVGNREVSLKGLRFTKGITFEFADQMLAPGGRIVLVKDREAFSKRYGTGVAVGGEYDGKLSDGGETLTLKTAADATIAEVKYSDKWHKTTDGKGKSLVLDDASSGMNSKKAWRPSRVPGGTPGKAETTSPQI